MSLTNEVLLVAMTIDRRREADRLTRKADRLRVESHEIQVRVLRACDDCESPANTDGALDRRTLSPFYVMCAAHRKAFD